MNEYIQINQGQLKEEKIGALPPKADYEFEIISAELKDSAKSSDGKMIKLKLKIFLESGRPYTFGTVLGQWKNGGAKTLETFFESVGLDINDKVAVTDLVGLTGKLHTKHGEFNGKPQTEVAWYVPQPPNAAKVKFAPKVEVLDDDVPF